MTQRVSYDGSAPFMSAAILTEGGDRIPLWFQGSTQRSRSSGQSLPFLAELTVRFQLANIPIITARLTPPYEDAISILDSEYVEWRNAKLEVQFGYTAGTSQGTVLSPVFSGILLKPEIQNGQELSITFNAQGVSTFNLPTQSGLRFLQGTRREIVLRLLRGPDPANPRRINIVDDEMRRAPEEVRRGWFESQIEVQQGGMSDWQWILTLIWECRAFFYIIDDSLQVFPRDTRSTAPVSRVFALYDFPDGQIGPGSGTYPILTINSPSMGIYLPGYLKGSVLQGVNPTTRQTETRVVDDSTVRSGRTGRGGASQAPSSANPGANPQNDGLEVVPGQPADRRLQEQVAAARSDFEQRAGIKLETGTICVPDMLPGEIVGVRGVGRRLSGPNYMVFDITHTLGVGGASTNFTSYANISQTWTRALPPEGPVPARTVSATRNPDRVEVLSRREASRS